MNKNYKDLHVVTAIIFNLTLMILIMATNNPLILLSVYLVCVWILVSSGNTRDLKNGIVYFIPFMITTVLINMIFSWEGSTILFYFLGKKFTLEALIYALILSFKLLIIIYIFRALAIMIDSDRAVSYFSSKLPKSTLTLMIGFKLFPSMKIRLKNLKEVYSIRGVDFNGKGLKDKIRGYIPILSILLESSLEGAFDIGEAAYIRGFLSGKRSVYDKQKFIIKDYSLIITSALSIICMIYLKTMELDEFDIYMGINHLKFINSGISILMILIAAMAVILLILSKEN